MMRRRGPRKDEEGSKDEERRTNRLICVGALTREAFGSLGIGRLYRCAAVR